MSMYRKPGKWQKQQYEIVGRDLTVPLNEKEKVI